jgi:hypothetical protein
MATTWMRWPRWRAISHKGGSMSDTIRQRLLDVVECFDSLEFALFTTFNFHPDFFEQNVLPTLFGAELENTSRKARERMAHKGLMHTSVSVFYDPAVASRSAERFRYAAFPVYLGPQRRFHPKLIALGGTDEEGTAWIYLAVLSANLTRAGWGVNGEGFADSWLHARSEQPAKALQEFLQFLSGQTRGSEALNQALAFFDRLQVNRSKADDPEGRERVETTAQRFYAAPSNVSLWDFLSREYGKLRAVRAASPYWGDATRIAETLRGVVPQLVAARGPQNFERAQLGADTLLQLGVDPADVLTWPNDNARFFHLKLYEIEARNRRFTGVGSCNFTEAGQFWQDTRGRAVGNVECMLFDEATLPWPREFLRPGAIPETSENEAPQTLPLYVTVGYDWVQHEYNWWLQGDPGEDPVMLQLTDGGPGIVITGQHEGSQHGELHKNIFQFRWRGETYEGLIAETNLQSSDLRYGGLLSPQQILDSWHSAGKAETAAPAEPEWPEAKDDDEDAPPRTSEDPAALPPFDWFTFFRSFEAWRKLVEAAYDRRELLDLLVVRTDSISTMVAAVLADTMPTAGRWIVVNACTRLLRDHIHMPEVKAQLVPIEQGAVALRAQLISELSNSLHGRGLKAKSEDLLAWYDKQMGA